MSQAQRELRQDASRDIFDSDICEAVIAAAQGKRRMPQSRSALLTARECDILTEISRGASNKEVARNLSISPSTVRTHMESIFRKLECSTRAAATLKGLDAGADCLEGFAVDDYEKMAGRMASIAQP